MLSEALYLAPLRELCSPDHSVIVVMGKSTPVQTEYVILDHIARGVSCVCVHIVFVLDEAVNMLDKDGLGDQTLRVKKCV
ncbi:hypothetical protein BGY98DRAFT_1032591 [Russula aff. rugulosa BPL654]|nr:hypothetical protein BGY98DRAFT_1032591 [Russula aff. rugulosa BPL654]